MESLHLRISRSLFIFPIILLNTESKNLREISSLNQNADGAFVLFCYLEKNLYKLEESLGRADRYIMAYYRFEGLPFGKHNATLSIFDQLYVL